MPQISIRQGEQSHGEWCPNSSGQHCKRSNPKSDKCEQIAQLRSRQRYEVAFQNYKLALRQSCAAALADPHIQMRGYSARAWGDQHHFLLLVVNKLSAKLGQLWECTAKHSECLLLRHLCTAKLVPRLRTELCKVHVNHTSILNHFAQLQWQDAAPRQTSQDILARNMLL